MILYDPSKTLTLIVTEDEADIILSALANWRGPWPDDTKLTREEMDIKAKKLLTAREMTDGIANELQDRYYAREAAGLGARP